MKSIREAIETEIKHLERHRKSFLCIEDFTILISIDIECYTADEIGAFIARTLWHNIKHGEVHRNRSIGLVIKRYGWFILLCTQDEYEKELEQKKRWIEE